MNLFPIGVFHLHPLKGKLPHMCALHRHFNSCSSRFRDVHSSDYSVDYLLLGGGLGKVGEGLAALELGVLDDT
jgi:hypothetical protein